MKARIYTYSGFEVNVLDAQPHQINIRDIAHALSLVNRFAGHTRGPISVAQHSVWVAKLCDHLPLEYQQQAILHDASEAYLGDVTKWLKATPEMAGYRAAEERLQTLIYERFNCPTVMHADVEEADRIMIRYEGAHSYGCGPFFKIDHPNYPPLDENDYRRIGKWKPMTWQDAEMLFLGTCQKLGLR